MDKEEETISKLRECIRGQTPEGISKALRELYKLRAEGILGEDEFKEKKRELLGRI